MSQLSSLQNTRLPAHLQQLLSIFGASPGSLPSAAQKVIPAEASVLLVPWPEMPQAETSQAEMLQIQMLGHPAGGCLCPEKQAGILAGASLGLLCCWHPRCCWQGCLGHAEREAFPPPLSQTVSAEAVKVEGLAAAGALAYRLAHSLIACQAQIASEGPAVCQGGSAALEDCRAAPASPAAAGLRRPVCHAAVRQPAPGRACCFGAHLRQHRLAHLVLARQRCSVPGGAEERCG